MCAKSRKGGGGWRGNLWGRAQVAEGGRRDGVLGGSRRKENCQHGIFREVLLGWREFTASCGV